MGKVFPQRNWPVARINLEEQPKLTEVTTALAFDPNSALGRKAVSQPHPQLVP